MTFDRDAQDTKRAHVRRWAQQAEQAPVEVVPFRIRAFHLSIPGRQEFRTLPTWKQIGWWLLLPVWMLWAITLHILEEFGYERKPRDAKPETVVVAGSTDNRPAVQMVDALRKSSRKLWLIMSRSRITFLETTDPHRPPSVIWQSPNETKVAFEQRLPDGLDLMWPHDTWAHFSFTADQTATARRFFQNSP